MDPICFNCGEPFFGGLCVWCTCDECGDNIRDGVCLNCNSHSYDQNSFNNPSNIPDFYTPPPPLFYCYNCGNPSEEGMPCGRCFCDGCGYTDCMCYTPSADTSFNYDPSFNNFPQNDFYEPNSYYNGDSYQNPSNFENCGGSFENSYHEPNSCYDSNGFYQPPQSSDFTNQIFEIKSIMDELKEMVNRMTSTPEPYERSMEEPRLEERKLQFCECCLYDDSSTIMINLNPQNDSISSPVEPVDSLTMGDEPLNTIPATESDEFNESSVENLVPIESEPGENSNGDFSFHPSFTPVEGSDAAFDEIEAFLANDSIPIIMTDDANFDPEGDIRLLEELLNAEPSTSLPPMINENLVDVESYSDSHNEYTTSDEDSCRDIDDIDEDDDAEIQDETLREKLSKVYLLISKIEALNDPPISSPIPVMDSDFLPELEIFRFEETSSGSPTIHADISLSDYERFNFEIDSVLISDNPSRDPLLEDVDLFLAADDSIPPGIENDENDILSDLPTSRPPAKPPDVDFELETNEEIFGVVDETYDHDDPVLDILPTQPTRDSEFDFAFIIRVFQPFFSYPLISSLFHSTGSEDTVFDPGISVFRAECPFHLLSPRTN
jgi:hypothetical protein